MKKKIIIGFAVLVIVIAALYIVIEKRIKKYSVEGNLYKLEMTDYNVKKEQINKLTSATEEQLETCDLEVLDEYFTDLPEDCGYMFSCSIDTNFSFDYDDVNGLDINMVDNYELPDELGKMFFAKYRYRENEDKFNISALDDSLQGSIGEIYYGTTFGKTREEIEEMLKNVTGQVSIQIGSGKEFDSIDIDGFLPQENQITTTYDEKHAFESYIATSFMNDEKCKKYNCWNIDEYMKNYKEEHADD